MSAESGIPIYRGRGGVWENYNWQEYACESAFQRNPQKVLNFHEIRRSKIGLCKPHVGYDIISQIQKNRTGVSIITQNIDGLHQKSGSTNVIELHGSIWRLRCPKDNILIEDMADKYASHTCRCGGNLRPDIVWFGDALNMQTINTAYELASMANLFISIGTSGEVLPAAGIPYYARDNGAWMIEINPFSSTASDLYNKKIRESSSEALLNLFVK